MKKCDDYDKCLYCKSYDTYEGCEWPCYDHEAFKANKDRLVEKAKEKGISISDLIALLEIG